MNKPVVELGFVSPDSLLNQRLTAKRGRHLCVTSARFVRTLLSQYTQLAIAPYWLFLVPVNCHGCQYCIHTEPSKSNAQLATKIRASKRTKGFAAG